MKNLLYYEMQKMSKINIASFSFSGISTFESCPRAFSYKYIQKQPEAFTSIEAFMGSSVHVALEWAYSQRQEGAEPDIQGAVDQYKEYFWNSGELDRARVIKAGTETNQYFDNGKQFLVSYLQRVFPGDKSATLYLEKRFELELRPGIKYKGIIDRVSRGDDGVLQVTDYKTGRTVHPLDNLQLPSYSLFVFSHNIDVEIRLCIEDLREKRTMVAPFRREAVKQVRDELLTRIDRILTTETFEANPGVLCHWCGYNHICDKVPESVRNDEGYKSNPCAASGAGPVEGCCPQCGGKLAERKGKFGRFMGCTNYPQCRYTYNLDDRGQERRVKPDTPAENICPECGSLLMERKGKYGSFFGCTSYPNCRFTRKTE